MKEILSSNLKFLRKKSGKSQSHIGIQLNKAHTSIGNWEKGIAEPSLTEIEEIAKIFEISAIELLTVDLSTVHPTGENKTVEKGKKVHQNVPRHVPLTGEIERKTPESDRGNSPFLVEQKLFPTVVTMDTQGKDNIVHIPVKARAGYLLGYADPEYIENLYSYQLPGLKIGTYRSFEVDGVSMTPTILPRDWVVGEWVQSFEDIRENRVHVVVTKNDGILIKRVLNRIKERGVLYLKSDTLTHRAEHPIMQISPDDIVEIWYARIKFSSDFSEPSEIYTRLNDMELSLFELQRFVGLNRLPKIDPELP